MDDQICSRCGGALDRSEVRGFCPHCLLLAATLEPPAPELAGYEIFDELGRGGTGVVYRARELASGEQVALKLIRSGEFASSEELARFHAGAVIAKGLQHPNIVRIRDCSHLHDAESFFTMDLIEGGSLAHACVAETKRNTSVLVTVARAVHFLHEHGVLHRDLKPANILVRASGEPVVTDFGAAKALGQGEATRSGMILGTLEYMAPEQLSGQPETVTVFSDVYGLGAILYQLQTGRPPFVDSSPCNLMRQIEEDQPLPPSKRAHGVSADIDTVCLRALEKDPKRRYPSASAFADDLARALSGQPILARPASTRERSLRWAIRHPVAVTSAAAAALLLVFIAAAAIAVASMQKRELRRLALDNNAYAAKAQAGAVLYQLREHGNALEAGARDPQVQALAAKPAPTHVANELESYARRFGSLLILAPDSSKWARWPTPAREWFDVPPRGNRDYVNGAKRFGVRGERKTYIARSFRSSVDHLSVFALSTPIFDGSGKFLGVLAATIPATHALGPRQDQRPNVEEPLSVLLGPDEGAPASGLEPKKDASEFTFLVHPALKRGEYLSLDRHWGALLMAAFGKSIVPDAQFAPSRATPVTRDDYSDPLLRERWLAAFAPVGSTGFVVLVQSREDVVLRPVERLVLRLAWGFGVSFLLILSLAWFFTLRPRLQTRVQRDNR